VKLTSDVLSANAALARDLQNASVTLTSHLRTASVTPTSDLQKADVIKEIRILPHNVARRHVAQTSPTRFTA
jgi:hypothetical protein